MESHAIRVTPPQKPLCSSLYGFFSGIFVGKPCRDRTLCQRTIHTPLPETHGENLRPLWILPLPRTDELCGKPIVVQQAFRFEPIELFSDDLRREILLPEFQFELFSPMLPPCKIVHGLHPATSTKYNRAQFFE